MQKAFLKDLLTYLPSKLLPALTVFITMPIITRLFLPAEYGYWALAAGFSDFLLSFAISGLGSGVVRFYAAFREKSSLSKFFASMAVAVLIGVIPVSVLSWIMIYLLKERISSEMYGLLQISICIFSIQSIFSILMNVLNAREASKAYTTFVLLNRYGSLALGLVLVMFFGFRVNGLLWGSFLVFAILISFLLRQSTQGLSITLADIQTKEVGMFWRYGLPLSIGNMAMWGLRISDRYIIGLYRPESDVGLYSVAYNLSGKSIEILASLFGLSMFPILISVWEKQGRGATEETLSMFTRIYLIIGLPATLSLTIFASQLVSLFAARAYHDGYRIVGYVAFSTFIWQLSQMASYGLLIHKKTYQIAINQLIASAINIGLNIVLVPKYGFVVAGITTLIGYLVLFVLQFIFSRPYLSWLFPWRTLANVSIACSLMSITAMGIYQLSGNMNQINLGLLILSILIAIVIYFTSLWLLGEANQNERIYAINLWNRLIKKTA